jgi:D-alanine-D-alanine ligase
MTYDLRKDYLAEGFSPEAVLEFDSEETIQALEETIRSLGYDVRRIGHVRALCAKLVAGERWDLVFNICEGVRGRSREAQVPCLLEAYGIPFTFSDPLVCAVTLDKAVAKRLVRDAGLNTPAYHVVHSTDDLVGVKLNYPLFAKPIAEGTGKGITQASRIGSAAELREVCEALLGSFKQPVLVEEFLPGREFTVGVLGTGVKARAIGTMEIHILPKVGGAVYSSETKEYCDDLVKYTRLADGPLWEAVQKLAVDSYRALECRDGGRVDIRLDAAGRPSFMEVNPLPGLHPQHSDLPMIATQEGISYNELIGSIIQSAWSRYSR